jgi:hypothetical protein
MGLFNKNENWWLKLIIVLLVLIFASLLSTENREVEKLKESHQIQIDSLETEIFIQKNMVGRYELTINHFIELKKLDSTEVNNYLSHETE